jgi:signal transduction histidine kinase
LHLPALALTAEIRHNVFLAFKEALHNVVKHAKATEVRLSLELRREGFMLVIADNGCGFTGPPGQDPAMKQDGHRSASGNGLANMQKRLEEIGGGCEWDTAPGEGTRAKLVVVVKAWGRGVIKTDDSHSP